MCGIAGYIGAGAFDASRLLRALAHRGPDAHGTWSTPVGDGRTLHLVHTRLKIVDLSDAAAQPMIFVSENHRRRSDGISVRRSDGAASRRLSNCAALPPPSNRPTEASTLALAYNGEIFNFRELRAELHARGHEFHSSGDTEVLLHGYAEWGTDVFVKCDGMFACAIYDGVRQQLVLARDHAGIKPLYWARASNGGLIFASEVRAIAASGMWQGGVDLDAVADFLAFGSVQEPATIYGAIRAFPAASFARVKLESRSDGCAGSARLDSGSVRLSDGDLSDCRTVDLSDRDWSDRLTVGLSDRGATRYWKPESFCALSASDASATSLRERHRDELRATIRAQLVADVPVGVFLSGGLDSTVLLELLPKEDRERVTAFTLGGELTSNDEVDVAARTCRNLGIRHIVVRPLSSDIQQWVSDGLAAMDQPSCDGLNTYLVSRASRAAGLVAVLNGAGADEMHGAYGHAFKLSRLIRAVSRCPSSVGRGLLKVSGPVVRGLRGPIYAERLRLMINAVPDAKRVLDERRRFFTPSQIAAIWPAAAKGRVLAHRPTVRRFDGPTDTPSDSSTVRPSQLRSLDLRSQITLAELRGYLRNTLLRDGDWATMANQQEMRVPYLGRRYMEFMLGLPWSAKTPAHGAAKPLLAGLISAPNRELLALPKRGFALNHDKLLRGPFREAFESACARLRQDLGFAVDPAELRASAQDAHPGKRANRAWGILALGRYLGR